jgi:hypothetical protein
MSESGPIQEKPQLQSTIEEEWEKAVRQHPEYREALKKAWHLLVVCRKPENQWITDCIFQERDDRPLRYIDVLFYSELIFQLIRGHLYYIGIEVKKPPVTNPEEKILDEITLAALESPFVVEFQKTEGKAIATLLWNKPVTVHSHRAGKSHLTKQLEPGSALLQIGCTRAITTGLALKEHKVIARWPHGHTFVYLLYTDLQGLFQGITDPSQWLNSRI